MNRCVKCGQWIKNPVRQVKCLGCKKRMTVGGGRTLGKIRSAQYCSPYCRLKVWRQRKAAS